MPEREIGRVKFWNEDKGYGFIVRSSGADLFVHVSQTRQLTLDRGEKVSFEIGENPRTRKTEAKNVAIIDGDPV